MSGPRKDKGAPKGAPRPLPRLALDMDKGIVNVEPNHKEAKAEAVRLEASKVRRDVNLRLITSLEKLQAEIFVRACIRVRSGSPRCYEVQAEKRQKRVARYSGGRVPSGIMAFDTDEMCSDCAAHEHVGRAIRSLREGL